MANAVAEKQATDVAVSNLSSLLEEEAGAGLENFSTEDMQIPFIRILQALSPQLNKQDSMGNYCLYRSEFWSNIHHRVDI